MKKRIDVKHLRLGMYVVELDRPWLSTPFLFQGFEVRTQAELQHLRALCHHVFIQTKEPEKSVAIQRQPSPETSYTKVTSIAHDAAVEKVDNPSHQLQLSESPPNRYPDLAPVHEELEQAEEIEQEARVALYTILDDARLGHSIDAPSAKKVVGQMTESILRNPDALVWLTHLKQKSEYTALHSLRVCVLALAFGRHLGYEPEKLNIIGTGALLHDIGKLKVPNEILEKPDRLTREEFEIVKTHVPSGLKILENAHGISSQVLEIVGRHHERYNGVGYSYGMQGDKIGEFGLIGAIVDTYDAITSDRAYHPSLSSADALKILYEARGSAYHPWFVEQFIQCMGIFPIGSIVELSNGSIGVVITTNRTRRLRPNVVLILSKDKVPYSTPKVVDLMVKTHTAGGEALEIRSIHPPGSFGINPTDYLPHSA